MRLEVFDVTITDWNESEAECFKDPIKELDLSVIEWTEILVNKNEVTVVFEAEEYSPMGNSPVETMAYYFNIKEEYFDNGGGFMDDSAPEVDWDLCRAFYKKYAEKQDDFVDALDKGDFERAKRLNKENPKLLKPSIQNSFYARWIVKTGSIPFMQWAKDVDPDLDFGPNPRFENPLKIAIGYQHEDLAIWLIDNFPDIPLMDKYDKFGLIKAAIKHDMKKLIVRFFEEGEIIDIALNTEFENYIPETIHELFLF